MRRVIEEVRRGDLGHQGTRIEMIYDNNFSITKIFPNPISEKLNIDMVSSYEGIVTISILSSYGVKSIEEKRTITKGINGIELQLQNLQGKGIYYMHIVDELGNSYVHRLVKSN